LINRDVAVSQHIGNRFVIDPEGVQVRADTATITGPFTLALSAHIC
jgi:hypothetical protein